MRSRDMKRPDAALGCDPPIEASGGELTEPGKIQREGRMIK